MGSHEASRLLHRLLHLLILIAAPDSKSSLQHKRLSLLTWSLVVYLRNNLHNYASIFKLKCNYLLLVGEDSIETEESKATIEANKYNKSNSVE